MRCLIVSGLHFGDLLGRDADPAVQRDAGAGEQRGEQVALVACDVRQETSGVDGPAAFSGYDEGEVVAPVLIAVFQA